MRTEIQAVGDWEVAYSNQGYVPHAKELLEAGAKEAAALRDRLVSLGRAELALPYGEGERHTFDLFWPEQETEGGQQAKGLVMFVHGGYWRAFDPSFWSHLAQGPLANGWAVAMPAYTLAPQARLTQIAQEVAEALNTAAAHVPGPIRITGHSAGGHLVSRLVCQNSGISAEVGERLHTCLSLSGLHDLRPMLNLVLNKDLHLDAKEAERESPALLTPRAIKRLICWVGGGETDEFRRQNALLANIWAGLGLETHCVEDGNYNHFNVIDGLAHADSPLTRALLAD